MKSIFLASAVVLTSLTLLADEPPAQEPSTTTTTAAPAVQPPATSPLAAAAKKSTAARGGKKSKISITNGNLSKTGGHITTSRGAGMPLPIPETKPTGKTPEQIHAEEVAKRAAAADAQRKKADIDQKKRAERAEAGIDDVALDANDDPAILEHRMETATNGSLR